MATLYCNKLWTCKIHICHWLLIHSRHMEILRQIKKSWFKSIIGSFYGYFILVSWNLKNTLILRDGRILYHISKNYNFFRFLSFPNPEENCSHNFIFSPFSPVWRVRRFSIKPWKIHPEIILNIRTFLCCRTLSHIRRWLESRNWDANAERSIRPIWWNLVSLFFLLYFCSSLFLISISI